MKTRKKTFTIASFMINVSFSLIERLVIAPTFVAVEDYPQGWPRLAAFLNSDDNFTIFRKFGQSHCRLLIQLQAEITELEQDLLQLDKSDSKEGSGTLHRLKRVSYLGGEDMVQKDKLNQLRKKLVDYGKACFGNPFALLPE